MAKNMSLKLINIQEMPGYVSMCPLSRLYWQVPPPWICLHVSPSFDILSCAPFPEYVDKYPLSRINKSRDNKRKSYHSSKECHGPWSDSSFYTHQLLHQMHSQHYMGQQKLIGRRDCCCWHQLQCNTCQYLPTSCNSPRELPL